jgi:hypothetical protein
METATFVRGGCATAPESASTLGVVAKPKLLAELPKLVWAEESDANCGESAVRKTGNSKSSE